MALVKLTDHVTIVNSYTDMRNYGVIRLQMENGVAKQKATLVNPIKVISLGMMIKGNDKKINFDKWYHDDLKGGVGQFLFYDNSNQTTYTARFITHPLQWKYLGASEVWTTTASLEYRII